MTRSTKKRIEWIDITRAVGMFLIIFGHALPNPKGRVAILVYTVNVPIFFVLSGFLYHSQSLKKQLVKLFYNLILPYFATGFLMLLIGIVTNNVDFNLGFTSMGSISATLSAIFWGMGTRGRLAVFGIVVPPIGTLWFLLALFWADIIFNFLIRKFHKHRYYVIIMTILSIVISLGSFLSATRFALFPWSLNAGLIGLIFMWYGYCIKKYDIFSLGTFHKCILVFLNIVLMLLPEIFSVHFWFDFAIADNIFLHDVIAILGGIGGSTLLIMLSYYFERLHLRINKAISWFGKNSLVVLCIDCMYGNVITLNNVILKALPKIKGVPFIESVLFVVVISSVAIYLFERLPLFKNVYFNRSFPFSWQKRLN